MKKLFLANAVVAALSTFGAISVASAGGPAVNASVTTDYKFRGISQTNSGPAFQGGFDYAFDNGFYVGNWNSNISNTGGATGLAANNTGNGAGLEMDFYGGYAGEFKGVGYDVGALYYYYNGVAYAPATPANPELNTLEVYGKLSYANAYAKLSYAVSDDYFGIAGVTNVVTGATSPDQGGSYYLDLGYTLPLSDKLSLTAHYGYTGFDKPVAVGAAFQVGPNTVVEDKYSDYSIGATYALTPNYSVTAAYVDTDKKAEKLFGRDVTEGSLIVTLTGKF